MTATYYKSKRGLKILADDHTAEGIDIVTSEPSKFMRATIFVLFALLASGVAWSFFGRADQIVTASGSVAAESQQNRVYVPVKGELVELYIAEGMPVSKGDVLARINSLGAVQLAGQAVNAQLKLADAERKLREFPAKQEAMRRRSELLLAQIDAGESELAKLVAEGMSKLGEQQRLKLDKAQAKLEKAAEQRDHARALLEQHQRLFNSPGGGGISGQQVAEKDKEYREKVIDYRLAEAELGEFEVALGQEYAKKQADLQKKSENLMSVKQQYQDHLVAIDTEERKISAELEVARTQAQIAARVQYEDIDEDNFLLVRAPEDGEIASVTQTQIGAPVEDKTPLAVIVPKDARKILEIEIDEKDRAFLTEGMSVKMKFNAFSYQRYGFISGKLEYVADVATYNRQTKKMIYRGRVGLERDYFTIKNVETPLHYGMAAQAEIIVEKRRLVDLALDPLRRAAAG